MTSHLIKLSITFICLVTFLIGCPLSTTVSRRDLPENEALTLPQWNLIGPGDADQVTSLNILEDETVCLGTDIGGIYCSTDKGESWVPRNEGLKNYDITTPVLQDPVHNEILYVGTRGGFYKSTDGGQSWNDKRSGLPDKEKYRLSGSIGSIAIDTFDSRVLYLGFGYRPSSDGTKTVRSLKWTRYIYKSTDRGESWIRLLAFPHDTKVNQIVPSHTRRGVLYAVTSIGIYEHAGSDKLWTRILAKPAYNILLFPDNPAKIMAAAGKAGVYITADKGKTWQPANRGLSFLAHRSGPNRYSVLAVDPDNSSRIYLLNSTWGASGGIYKTEDQGAHWNRLTSDFPESWLKTSRRMNAITINKNNPQTLYLGSSRYVYRSDDGGTHWQQLISKPSGKGWTHSGLNVFGHTRKVAADPVDSDILYIATSDHGIVKSTDGGLSWNVIGRDLKYGDSVWDIDICPARPEILYLTGTSVKGGTCISVSMNKGESWESRCSNLSRETTVFKVLIAPDDCSVVYLATNRGVIKTVNGGRHWFPAHNGMPDLSVYSMVFHPDNPAILFAGTKKGLYKSDDSAQNWGNIPIKWSPAISSVLVSKHNDQLIMVGTEQSGKNRGGIYRSTDGGTSWAMVLEAQKMISGIVQVPGSPDILYAASNDHNYHDYNHGSGVFRSTDYGKSWESINQGLPVLRAWNITMSPSAPGLVFLSTNGSGAYIIDDQNISDR
jgi:photosystem II stability/assembly factor-like uncharacterized protein